MSAKLFKASGKRKNRVVVLRAELYRERGAAAWRLSLRYGGKRASILDTGTAIEAAAEEFAVMAIRNITAPQQPAASSQQPAASSQQPAATDLIPFK